MVNKNRRAPEVFLLYRYYNRGYKLWLLARCDIVMSTANFDECFVNVDIFAGYYTGVIRFFPQ